MHLADPEQRMIAVELRTLFCRLIARGTLQDRDCLEHPASRRPATRHPGPRHPDPRPRSCWRPKRQGSSPASSATTEVTRRGGEGGLPRRSEIIRRVLDPSSEAWSTPRRSSGRRRCRPSEAAAVELAVEADRLHQLSAAGASAMNLRVGEGVAEEVVRRRVGAELAAVSATGMIATASKRTDGPAIDLLVRRPLRAAAVGDAADLRRDDLQLRPLGFGRRLQADQQPGVRAVRGEDADRCGP